MSFILLNGRALCVLLASTFCERDFGNEGGIPAGVEGGGQTAWRMITLLRGTADAVGEWNLVGHISTACSPPALPPSPTFNHNKKRLIACLWELPVFRSHYLPFLGGSHTFTYILVSHTYIFFTLQLHAHAVMTQLSKQFSSLVLSC